MYKALSLLVLVAAAFTAENVQKRQIFLSSSYPGTFNSVTYEGFPSVYYGGYPTAYGSPFFGAPFVTFEQPKEKKDGEEKKEEKKEEKEEEKKKEGDKKEEVQTIQYIIPAASYPFSSYPFWFRK